MKTSLMPVWVALLGMLALGTGYAAYNQGETVTIDTPQAEDLYLTGETISVEAPVDADLVAAGRDIAILAPVSEDLIAAGETIRLEAPVDDDVRMAGRTLAVNGTIGGHWVGAGESVRLGTDGRVTDWAWLAGRDINIQGRIGADSRLAGQTITISGQVDGDLTLYASRVVLTSTATIDGDVALHIADPERFDNRANVSGDISLLPVEDSEWEGPGPDWGVAGGVFGILLTIVTSVVLYLLFPGYLVGAAEQLSESPFKSLGLAILILIGIPILIVVLFFTGLGAVLALTLLAGYLILLLIGGVTGQVFLAAQGLKASGRGETAGRWLSVLAIVLAIALINIVQLIPFVGALLTFLLFLLGLGAAMMHLWQRYRGVY